MYLVFEFKLSSIFLSDPYFSMDPLFRIFRSWDPHLVEIISFSGFSFFLLFFDLFILCAGVWFQRAWRGWRLARGEGRCGRTGRHRIR
jgi:hypothetical protein